MQPSSSSSDQPSRSEGVPSSDELQVPGQNDGFNSSRDQMTNEDIALADNIEHLRRTVLHSHEYSSLTSLPVLPSTISVFRRGGFFNFIPFPLYTDDDLTSEHLIYARGVTLLNLAGRGLTELPDRIEFFQNVRELNLESNQLTTLPDCISELEFLSDLLLEGNCLRSLPPSLGKLIELEWIDISLNSNMHELPISLGDCLNLKHINVCGTAISQEDADRVLAMCKATREEGELGSLPQRIQLWKSQAYDKSDNDYDLAFVNDLEEGGKYVLIDWLKRLSLTSEAKFNQSRLAKTVCSMLQDIGNDSEWEEMFFAQVEANNAACEDRSSQAFNELFVAWTLNKLDQNVSVKDKIDVIAGAAKTLALRNAIGEFISRNPSRESVEVYLYYESTLQEELGLLTAMQDMYYSTLGIRSDIDVDKLKAKVYEGYQAEMAGMEATLKIAREDASFQTKFQQIEDDMYQRLEDFTGNSVDLQDHCKRLMLEKERREKKLLLEWIKATMDSSI